MTAVTTGTRAARTTPARPATRVPVLQRPLASYHLLLTSIGLLMALGLVMVFSASSVRAYATYGSSYAIAVKQAIFLALGVPIMLVCSRLPVRFWRLAGYPLLLVAIALLVLVLVPGIGKNVDGATRWIPLPMGFNLQPSELGKLALALWGADLLVRKKKLLGDWKHLFVPLVPVACVVLALVMLEPDMGTTLATVVVVVALLWVVGTPARYFVAFLAVLVTMATALAVAEPYRMARLVAFVDPCSAEKRLAGGYQACQGLLGLGSGGLLGEGLGASRQKWAGGLPNAHTDFVYAIIGEELGLLGTLTVLLLFATLVYGGLRVAQRTTDPFARLAAFAVTAWIACQAVINIGTVVGLVPITGIPLPLVSFGGSALLPTCVALGMLLSFARREPGAPAALAARRGAWRRTLRLPAPQVVPAQRTRSADPSGGGDRVHVVLAGGGTAGHVEPALALADALRRADPAVGLTFLGTATGLEARLVPARGHELAEVPRVPLPRRPTLDLLKVPSRVLQAVRRTRAHLDRVGADVVVGFGGYVALPAYLAARRAGVPFVVHEANARAGLANRVGARMTPFVAAAVEGSGLRGARVLGIPLRRQVAHLDRGAARAAARASYGLTDGPVLLVTGGSQGAQRINAAVTGAAADLAAAGVQVLHVTGPKQADAVREQLGAAAPPTHHVLAYVDGMESAYAASDLVLCRAGAMTCAELAAVGLPAVYVPLPIGNGEQALNAQPLVTAGGGVLVDDADLDAERVLRDVLPLLLDAPRLTAMGTAAAALGHRDADSALVALVEEAARR